MALVVLLGDAYHKTKKLLVDGNYMMKCLDTFRVYYLRLCDSSGCLLQPPLITTLWRAARIEEATSD
jgi:hypothetical protein